MFLSNSGLLNIKDISHVKRREGEKEEDLYLKFRE